MAPTMIHIWYTREPGTTFDYSYYTTEHIPLALSIRGRDHGAKAHSVTRFDQASGDMSSGFHLAAIFEFSEKQQYEAAMADERTEDIMDDVPNFTKVTLVFLVGEVLSTG
ncbi:hypothetical protein LTR56_026973 [Elasticomyces elasticus]|nr:hypothetical protein LTR56_026973 [Elasticomyces elasticus]KAK4908461.1 hypothetical protein LTR49_022667 [Elasticomyces elasticus]KAK5735706.1 hypothetical protein LTS12_026388 [Elasticomyces elasticus]